MISGPSSAPMAGHTTAIDTWPPSLQDIKQLQHFFGMGKFYHRFLPTCIRVLWPRTYLLKGGTKIFDWTDAVGSSAVLLQHPAPNAERPVTIDASDSYVGGIM
jgi:hypothetical protein